MSNTTFRLSITDLFTLRRMTETKPRPAEDPAVKAGQDEAIFKAYVAGTWQSHAGTSAGGWGTPW